MEKITKSNVIAKKIIMKQELEAKLAKKLYAIYAKDIHIKPLQNTVLEILKSMVTRLGRKQSEVKLRKAINDEPYLRLWKKLKKDLMHTWLSTKGIPGTLDPTDCGDIFRLAGAWVEYGAGDDYVDVEDPGNPETSGLWAKTKDWYRPGVDGVEDTGEVWAEEK